jgi:L-2,4-diaminobutyric acid acetyltransferase
MGHLGLSSIELRKPTIRDAAAMWNIVDHTEVLDTNSLYHYLLMCRDFSDTSIVACHEGTPIGFITAYLRPESPENLFAWQTAVDPDVNAPGLATHMLKTLTDRTRARGVRHLETSINPGNRAVQMMLRRFAQERGAQVESGMLFDETFFPADHEAEILYRIGPLG